MAFLTNISDTFIYVQAVHLDIHTKICENIKDKSQQE